MSNIVNAEKIHIGIFGLRNAGKSSIINSITGQNLAIVSDTPGTTTDPVKKAMELLPLGPVVIVDTPGLDDEGELGLLRVKKAKQVLNYVDIALLVIDAQRVITKLEEDLIELFKTKSIPYIIAYNKTDLITNKENLNENEIYVSAKDGTNINELKEMLARILKRNDDKKIVQDLVNEGDTVLLVIPIDAGAPKGRIILPQQQVLRELIDKQVTVVIASPNNLKESMEKLSKKPDLVITDSQVFGVVDKLVPEDVLLTSFSILFARYKGNLETLVKGVEGLDRLKDDSYVLITNYGMAIAKMHGILKRSLKPFKEMEKYL